jgi:hypothetical protein
MKHEFELPARLRVPGCLPWLALVGWCVFVDCLRAQDHTVVFNTGAAGVSRAITNWGMSVTWPSPDNMRRTLIFMGTNEVDFVHLPFIANQPLTNGDLTAAQKAELTTHANIANIAGTNKPWSMSIGTGSGVDPWYKSGTDVIPGRWVQAMEAAQRFYGKPILFTEPFNEPDYGWGQGTVQNLYDILGLLQASTNFTGTILAGGSTLNCDLANSWYDPIKTRATSGTTHALGGSFNSYVSFYQDVLASGDVAIAPEAHNLVEVIAGAEYGVNRSMFWGAAELARGNFVKACQGQRLGYSEDRPKWTGAAVYRATNGAVQAFLGGNERMGQPTSYRFFSRDRDVFYNGDGPRRDFTVSISGDQERVVGIAWGADVPPVIDGRYIVVNRNSGKVMEVAGASTNNGANIQQNTYTGGTHQQWDIVPFSSPLGDQSFYAITAAHSGKAADVNNFSYDDGGNVQQWQNLQGANQHWFFEYAGSGYFYIRSRWSGKYLDVAGLSIANGANIWQWTGLNGLNQQWRLIPVGATVEFVAPAAPAGVVAAANALSVQLNWDANTEPDLESYTVLRGTNSGGPYDIVARGLTNNAFTDKAANQSRAYFYVVKAVDRSLNASTNSAQVSASPTGANALVARFAFDGNANDSSGNANQATLTGSPSFVAGKYGSALDLSGANQYGMLPASLLASVTNFTIAVWVNWDGGAAWQRIFDFGNDTTQYMFLTPSSGSGTLRFAITTNGGGAEQILQTTPLPVGLWEHIAITRSANSLRLYTNGVLAVSGTGTISPASFNPVLNFLGESQYEADPLFNGRLDELFIYNYALSGTEISRLAANQPPPPTVPTRMSTSLESNALLISWPSNYAGCRLESNAASLTATGLWFTVPGSASSNLMSIPISPSRSNIFFRLAYP